MSEKVVLPELGENITSGVVVSILVKVGDRIEAGQPVVEIETDKAVVEVPSDSHGTVTEIYVAVGEEIRVGGEILALDPVPTSDLRKGEEPVTEAKAPSVPESSVEQPETKISEAVPAQSEVSVDHTPPPPPAAPSVRRFAREIGVDIRRVKGSGPGGRISVEDVKAYSRSRPTRVSTPPETSVSRQEAVSLPDFSRFGNVQRKPMSMVRRKTAAHLSTAWTTIPQVTQFDRADMTHLELFRKTHAGRVEAEGGKLTLTSILLKIVAAALKVFTKFNCSIDMENEEIIIKEYVHIGVAVDTQHGLLVPVVRDADRKNLITLSTELTRLAERARARKLSIEEMQGGNFTISNLGGIGGTAFTPIVNAPEVAILGVSRTQSEPVMADGRIETRLMLPLSLSYDHRLIDGADAARFLKWIATAIEQPLLLSLEN